MSPRTNNSARAVHMVIADGEPVRDHVRMARSRMAWIDNPVDHAPEVALAPANDLILASVDVSVRLQPERAVEQRSSLLK